MGFRMLCVVRVGSSRYGSPRSLPPVTIGNGSPWGQTDCSPDLKRTRYVQSVFVPQRSQTFTYDLFGNINKSGSVSFQPSYDLATNHYVTLPSGTPTYDANGNL